MAVREVSVFGNGSGVILMSKVNCNGDEESLSNCSHSTSHVCDHAEDAGVICHITSVDDNGSKSS